jgi:hypothetical protein
LKTLLGEEAAKNDKNLLQKQELILKKKIFSSLEVHLQKKERAQKTPFQKQDFNKN